jgi:hypothetical protein
MNKISAEMNVEHSKKELKNIVVPQRGRLFRLCCRAHSGPWYSFNREVGRSRSQSDHNGDVKKIGFVADRHIQI